MDDRERVYRLLCFALMEIRDEGRRDKNKVAFRLADLFHNLPLELSTASAGGKSYSEILGSLRERSKEKGCGEWVQRRLDEFDEQTRQGPGDSH